MSNKTFNLSSEEIEHTVSLPHRDLQLDRSPESPTSHLSLPSSPDSNSSISNLDDREADSSPDITMLECCLSNSAALDNHYIATLTKNNVFCGVSTNLNHTFIATPIDGSVNFWNENLSLLNSHETGSENYQTFNKNPEDGSDSAVTSPDSAGRESQLSSCETSQRGSTENDCCSLSSGEMVIRSDSFCLEDQSLLVVSSLEESSKSSATGHLALPADFNLLSATWPDVCEASTERVTEQNTGHPCLGITFNQADIPTEENDLATSNSLVTLPSENEGGLFMTFLCETSPADCGKEAQFASAEAELFPRFPVACTPEQGKTFVSTLSAMQDTDKDIHTSTPLQNIGNKIPSLPSFSESPCIGNACSPGLHPAKQQQSSVTPKKSNVSALPPTASKAKKAEIKKFPKTDFSSIKSKVITRNVHKMSMPGPASQHRPSQANVNNQHPETGRGAGVRISPAKVRSSTAKTASDAQRRVSTGAASLGVTSAQSSGFNPVDGQHKSRASPFSHHPAASKHTAAVQCSNASSETEQAASSQAADAAAQHFGNRTFCSSSIEKSPGRSGQPPKKVVSSKIEVGSGSAVGQDKSPGLKTRPRCSSESSSSSYGPPKEQGRSSTSFTIPKADSHLCHTKPGDLICSSQNKRAIQTEASNGPAEDLMRKAESSKSTTAGASWDDRHGRLRGQPSCRQARGTPPSHPPAASPRAASLSARQRQGTQGRDEGRTSRAVGTPQSRQKSSAGSHRVQTAGEPCRGSASTVRIKHQVSGSRPPLTPTRPPLMGPPVTPASRLSNKAVGPSRSLTVPSIRTEESPGSKQVSGGAAHKPTPLKTVAALKARPIITPGKNTGQSLASTCKPAVASCKGAPPPAVSRRPVRLTSRGPVDKNQPKASSRQQHPQQQASQPHQSNRPPDVVPAGVTKPGRREQSTQQLRGLLAASNCRFEAVAIVLQQTLAERDEATKQCRELSQELVNLQGELVSSITSSERLEKEKDELRVALDDALQALQEQHQKDLAELEHRLQAFYQAEWDKVHLTYQEEADKCKTLMEQQMGELKANHEAMKLELESSHTEQLQCVKQQYEMSLEELSKVHRQELQSLEKTLKDSEAALSGQIEVLTAENNALIEKLTAEENRRKELAEKTQKDSHTLYLEQELESLKVVLDIKNKQLHQQEKKLMEIDKLKEKNVKLDESLKKVQQENEDLKARMDRHAALSRQLSTEQAALQESLQKESKVNKRLSMENEELMWKLHNGDLSSPRKVSPTSPSPSPSHSFSLQSPRSSGLCPSTPVSPR